MVFRLGRWRGRHAIGVRVALVGAVVAVGAGVALAAFVPVAPAAEAGYAGDYYVALGDSLSVGVQPRVGAVRVRAETTESYPRQLTAAMTSQHRPLRLVPFGCSGATSTELLRGGRCGYAGARSQLGAAERFMALHRRQVRFITLDIGINDINPCLRGNRINDACVARGLAAVRRNLPVIFTRLRAAAPTARVAAMTYYDPKLGLWIGSPAGQAFAARTLSVFSALNQVIVSTAQARGVLIADVAGEYETSNFIDTDTVSGDRVVPRAVARVCEWTWMCAPAPAGPDIHANKAGYATMARAFRTALS